MIKLDLHTHSIISPDGAGSITRENVKRFLDKGVLDCIAITDHNETRFALDLHEELGAKIIVGEEITTRDGEMIGLFLQKTVSPGLTAQETVKAIRAQGGLVYIPHPFETFRKGLQVSVLEKIIQDIDIFEVFNGRGRFRGKTKIAEAFAEKYQLVCAASSDAHGAKGIGRTYSLVKEIPTKTTLKQLLRVGKLQKIYAPYISYLYPIVNMIKNTFL